MSKKLEDIPTPEVAGISQGLYLENMHNQKMVRILLHIAEEHIALRKAVIEAMKALGAKHQQSNAPPGYLLGKLSQSLDSLEA